SYELQKDPDFFDLLKGLGNLVTHPKAALDMLYYDPSELGKYLTASTSVFGLIGGLQDIFQKDKNTLAGVLQLGASSAYIYGEMAMGGISEEKLHKNLGSNPEEDMAILEAS